ncbi:3-isopropylmalate dehydratase [Variovorax sp. PAMC28562]|uniref:3-isopropylmalate dehydratase large subunit n=1 Tax=Variovorax sp. PAMC28562 TaxID=2762323 RepID=UPI00164D98CB|nr:aconitase family protein [Variovorax sp. PAMC28562]QNK72929.1 3-isopropylmalate dehydratase [Variovorax sp. PAMC28562]
MSFTITEKILARVSGLASVKAGDEVMAKPDFVLAYDFPGYTDVIFKQLKDDFGITKMPEPERFGIFIDHMVPAISPAEEELHKGTREWTTINDVKLYERKGIGHQVSSEVGYATPGAFVVHFDGHVSQLGTFGTLAMGLRRNVLEAFALERVSIRVPHTTRVDLVGKLQPGVMARDVFHHLVRVLGAASCRFQVLEIGGPAVADMSNDALQTITGLAMFTGAVTAIVNPDAKRLEYAMPRARIELEPVYSDEDAHYAARHEIDLSTLEPIIVIPPSPANTRDLSDYLNLPVHTGYLGSCASGRIEDLRAAAQVLAGRQVAPGFALHVVPTSQEIMAAASREGLLSVFVEAGAFVSSPSCDYCFGRIATMAPGQRAVSTGTLNVRGRMGSPDSEIYLCNAAVLAASAVEGKIADPRPYLAGNG